MSIVSLGLIYIISKGFTQTHVHWVSDAIQPSHPLSSPSPPASIFPSIRVFSSEPTLPIRWPKYWSFGFCISPSNEYSGLISFRIDWFDLLAVQGTLKSFIQHHSLKASLHGSQSCHGERVCVTQWSYEPCRAGPPKTDGSLWRVLTKRGPLEKEMATHSSILAWRTSLTV